MRKKLISSVLAMLVLGGGSLPAYGAAGSSAGQEAAIKMPPKGAHLTYTLVGPSATVKGDMLTVQLTGLTTWMSGAPLSAGNMPTEDFFKSWNEGGKESFRADPPNAGLVWYTGDTAHTVVVELSQLKDFKAASASNSHVTATFQVKVLTGGPLPSTLEDVRMFVDWGGSFGGNGAD